MKRTIALLAVAVVFAVVGYFGFRLMRGLVMLAYVDSAILRMRVLSAAETQFVKAHPAYGYACELSELAQNDEVLLSLAKNNIANGYAFEIASCHAPDEHRPNPAYYATARPLHTGQPAFCLDQSGVVKADYSGSVEACRSNGVPF